MIPFRTRMLASTVIPVAVALGGGAAGVVIGGAPLILAVPVRAACNPCAAKNPCNPCAIKAAVGNSCNPCAAKNPCNPCAAKNPCAAAGSCNPCAATASNCVIPRLQMAALKNPSNPCAAQNPCTAKNPCNPCAIKASATTACSPRAPKNPCNPCAARNPCNPCAVANPCNPCAAGAAIDLTDRESAAAYDCLIGELRAAYGKSGHPVAAAYQGWQRYSKVAYQSATHGNRFVQNYANPAARAYGAYEKAGRMPVGATLAKDSFSVDAGGRAAPGPLFVMEKMAAGFNPGGGDWKYTMIMPDGSVFGETGGKNAGGMQFCVECHIAVGDEHDSLMFVPEEYRAH